MPSDLVLVRHGESEGNVAMAAAKGGDLSLFTDAYATTPGRQWRLTDRGRQQAAAIGGWLRQEFPTTKELGAGLDWFYASPYVRTRETAAHLGLPGARWLLNRGLRERDWGDIGSMDTAAFRRDYPQNARIRDMDPLYWRPPGGESIAQVAEDRVKNVLATLHREADGQRVIAVNHGEMMWAFRLQLERWNDEEFLEQDRKTKIHNCHVLHYTRVDPTTRRQSARLSFVREAWPQDRSDGKWVVETTEWRPVSRRTLSNDDLLTDIADVPQLFATSATDETAAARRADS